MSPSDGSPHKDDYSSRIDAIRAEEYPMLKDTTYLDHAGTTLYAKSLIETFSKDLMSNLYGNPHSASLSSQRSTRRIDDTRLKVLRFFNADPEEFDVVFTANATAGIKLVANAFRDHDGGFWYGCHSAAHTSLVGVREMATGGHTCFRDDAEVDGWISSMTCHGNVTDNNVRLFAYPGQSNMSGYRSPLRWCGEVRKAAVQSNRNIYTLLDAAALASTCPIDLSDVRAAPDFLVVSFYKIFGFPDLGALIVRKDSAHALGKQRYFGGGTVDMVISVGVQWHAKKDSSLHDRLEEGTLPFHNIVALNAAFDVHKRLFGSMVQISRHTSDLAQKLYQSMSSLRHNNGLPVCEMYKALSATYGDAASQGATLSFNLRSDRGEWIGKSEVEKLAAVKNIELRSGTLCNPGESAQYLAMTPNEMKANFARGQRCGDENDVLGGKPTGAIRVSLGAMSSMRDVDTFVAFLDEFYVEKRSITTPPTPPLTPKPVTGGSFHVESLSVFPIKSCAAFCIPPSRPWKVYAEGLAWDREWCLIHQGTGTALSQKRYPRMALLRPTIDLARQSLRISHDIPNTDATSIEISLSRNHLDHTKNITNCLSTKPSSICGDTVTVQVYPSPSTISTFFTQALSVPCTLARFPPKATAPRHAKSRRPKRPDDPSPLWRHLENNNTTPKPILLSNESPILLISRSSVNRLNEQVKANNNGGKAIPADSFRANIIVAEDGLRPAAPSSSSHLLPSKESPYVEDTWSSLSIINSTTRPSSERQTKFNVLGSCQRCQMVCVDQETANRNSEPYSTLAKTRRIGRGVYFGMHLCLDEEEGPRDGDGARMIQVGDVVRAVV